MQQPYPTVYSAAGRDWVPLEDAEKVQVLTLAPPMYEQLVKKLNGISVDNDTSPMRAGYLLGIQKVLTILREEGLAVIK